MCLKVLYIADQEVSNVNGSAFTCKRALLTHLHSFRCVFKGIEAMLVAFD